MIHFPLRSAKKEFLRNAAVHCPPLPTNGSAIEKNVYKTATFNTTKHTATEEVWLTQTLAQYL